MDGIAAILLLPFAVIGVFAVILILDTILGIFIGDK